MKDLAHGNARIHPLGGSASGNAKIHPSGWLPRKYTSTPQTRFPNSTPPHVYYDMESAQQFSFLGRNEASKLTTVCMVVDCRVVQLYVGCRIAQERKNLRRAVYLTGGLYPDHVILS
jgi:hypothetical protein